MSSKTVDVRPAAADPLRAVRGQPPAAKRITVGIHGASGTAGAELIRLLWDHSAVTIAFGSARQAAGQSLTSVDPAAPEIQLVHPDEVDPAAAEVVFLSLPHGASAPAAARALEGGARVIDLSGDLRLTDEALHDRVYGSARPAGLAAAAVYGLTELARAQLPAARLVSNPGCYPTSVALGLGPLAEAGRLKAPPVVSSVSGVSGAGRAPSATTHFCSASGDVRPYKVGRAHRHVAEMEQTLTRLRPDEAEQMVIFTPHLVPIERGILSTMVVGGIGIDAAAAREIIAGRYAGEPFVEVLPEGGAARIRAVANTNRAVVSVHDVEGVDAVVVACAIDNLIKGAAGQAIQNMNVMLGLDEAHGLPGAAWHAGARGRDQHA